METSESVHLHVTAYRGQYLWYVVSKHWSRPPRVIAKGPLERLADTAEDEPLLALLLAASQAYRDSAV